ncbi:uncharacterized protein TNCV_4249011 [Trichonephila clavipes]|nr:uncharacterized protein TNCV_4249011 [Trichonephila clavipes]
MVSLVENNLVDHQIMSLVQENLVWMFAKNAPLPSLPKWLSSKLLHFNLVKVELWFQQDGATYHTARATIDFLKGTFGDRLISRFGLVNWPPRSCDLTPLDYFLWGYVKSLVYADKPQTLDHLEDNIRRVIADIRPQMLEKVIENWTSRGRWQRSHQRITRGMVNQRADSRREGRRSGTEKKRSNENSGRVETHHRCSQERRVGHSQPPNTREYRDG